MNWNEDMLNKALDEDGQFVNDMFGGQHFDVLGLSKRCKQFLISSSCQRTGLSQQLDMHCLSSAMVQFGMRQVSRTSWNITSMFLV